MSERRADLDPLTRAVSDVLDELLWRHHGIATSWSNPESFLKWLRDRGFDVTPLDVPAPVVARPAPQTEGERDHE